MRPDPASKILTDFSSEVRRLRGVKSSGEKAYNTGHLRRIDLDYLIGSTFLTAVVQFELFLERLFFSSLLGISQIRGVQAHVPFSSLSVAERVVVEAEGGRYLDWLPMQRAIKRAETYLRHGQPFTRLTRRPREKEILHQVLIIRHAIAHKSPYSIEQFSKTFPIHRLPPTRRHPAGFLQTFSIGGRQSLTHHELLLADLVRIAHGLSAPTNSDAVRFLGVEGGFSTNEKPGKGQFACESCGHLIRLLSSRDTLSYCANCSNGPCPTCGRSTRSRFRKVAS